MSNHTTTCQSCGQQVVIECDKRQLGTGRKHDAGWKPGPNHETVRKALYLMSGWRTVKQVQMFLNNAVSHVPDSEWAHQGKSTFWTQLAVEGPMSDLRGTDVVESMLPAKGRGWMYKIREGTA